MDLFERESIEIAEAELDRFIERRAREAGDAQRVEEEWVASVRRYHDKRRETSREAWRAYHLAQAARLEATAAAFRGTYYHPPRCGDDLSSCDGGAVEGAA